MKTTDHVEYLLRQGKKPKELLALGFPKQVITRVRRRLKEEKVIQHAKVPKGGEGVKGHPKPLLTPGETGVLAEQKLAAIESELKELESRIALLEATATKSATLEDLNTRLDGTPALGLRQRFQCQCGASGFVALHLQCTKCGRETWWGWFPK